MHSLNYHRQYLWIFFYMYFVLMWIALIMDCVYVDAANANYSFAFKTPRFLNVVFVFIFATISALLQHQLPKSVFKSDLLKIDHKYWKKRLIKVKTKKEIKKVVKKRNYFKFFFIHAFANFIGLIPLITLVILGLCDVLDDVKDDDKVLSLAFFLTAAVIKYLAWYVTNAASRLTIFKGIKRLNMVRN